MKILGLGVPELLIILAVALLIFGPKHLPKLGSALGKTVKGFRDGLGNTKKEAQVDEEPEAPKRKKKAAAKKIEAAKEVKEDAPKAEADADADKQEKVATEASEGTEEPVAEKAEA